MPAMLLRTKTKTNPVFYADRVRLLLEHDPERIERMRTDPTSVDLLTWNIFASLNTDEDREYLAGVLQTFGGPDLAAPVSLSLWTGRHAEPRLEPSYAYLKHIREAAGQSAWAELVEFSGPIEVPVRIESPRTLVLIETALDQLPRGRGGRDRLVELVDAGLVHAGRVGKQLAVAVVYRSGTEGAAQLSRRVNELRDPKTLAAAMPWRRSVPEVVFRETTWQQLFRLWENERDHYKLFGQPVRAFLRHADQLGIR
jgi:hypothetical protein